MDNNSFNNSENNNSRPNLDQELATFLKTDYCEIESDPEIKKNSLKTVIFYILMFLFFGSFILLLLQQFYISTHNITSDMLKKDYIHYDKVISDITNFSAAYGNLLIYAISLTVILFFMHKALKKDLIETRKIGVGSILKYCLIGYAIFIFCSYLGNAIITGIGNLLNMSSEAGNEQGIIDIMSSGTNNLIIMSISTVLLAPFLEEIVFRKSLFNLLSKKLKPIFVIIISGLIFGSIHIIDPVITAFQSISTNGVKPVIYEFSYIFVYGLMGIAFGIVYQLSHRNIIVTIILHMINNFLSVLLTIIELYDLAN